MLMQGVFLSSRREGRMLLLLPLLLPSARMPGRHGAVGHADMQTTYRYLYGQAGIGQVTCSLPP